MELGNRMLETVLADGGPENYKKWSRSFEDYILSKNYALPRHIVTKWQSYNTPKILDSVNGMKHKVFDAGCGTGLVGKTLLNAVDSGKLSAKVEIYGGDLCKEMLDIAKTKDAYCDLSVVNLKEELPYDTEFFDSIVCAGVFCQGHCGPGCLPELFRVLKRSGHLIATVRKDFYRDNENEWEKQAQDCSCKLLETAEVLSYADSRAILLIFHKK